MVNITIAEDLLIKYTYREMVLLVPFISVHLSVVSLANLLKLLYLPPELTAAFSGMVIGLLMKYFDFISWKLWIWQGGLADNLFFPIILMKLLYTLDVYIFSKSIVQILIICFATQLSYVTFLGFMTMIISDVHPTLFNIIFSGLVLIPNDVPEIHTQVDSIKNLKVLMEAESAFSLITSYMLYHLLVGYHIHIVPMWYQIIFFLIRYVLFGLLLGTAIGLIIPLIYKHMYNDSINAIVFVVSLTYSSFLLCETLFYCNGSLAVLILYLFLNPERSKLTTEVDTNVKKFINFCYHHIELLLITIYSSNILINIIDDFKWLNLFISFCVYIMGMALRFLVLFMLKPVLSRLAYGFNFTSTIIIFWVARKGPLQLMYAMYINQFEIHKKLGNEIFLVIFVFVVLSFIFNVDLLLKLLKKTGIIKMSAARQSNIINGFKILEERRGRLISFIKMNRFFSDANWPLIQETTKLKKPFKDEADQDDFMYLYWNRHTICPNCTKSIPVEPTKGELASMLREVRLKILKTERISFIRQYEGGLLSNQEIKILLQTIGAAIDSNDLEMKQKDLDLLLRLFKKNDMVNKFYYMTDIKTTDFISSPPKQKCRRMCYLIMINKGFNIFIYVWIVLNAAWIITDFILREIGLFRPILIIIKWIFQIIYIFEFFVKFLGLSANSLKEGFDQYIKNNWNKFDFALLLFMFYDLFLDVIEILNFNKLYASNWKYLIWASAIIRIMRLLKLLTISEIFYPKILIYFEHKKDIWVSNTYTIQKALILAYDEAIELLPIIANNEKIREVIKTSLDNDKLFIINEMGLLEKERPWVTTTVKTKQLINAVLVYLKTSVQALKSAGFVDNFEYKKLISELDNCVATAARHKVILPVRPKNIFCQVPWICNDNTIIEYLYYNVATKIWNANEVIVQEGEKLEGVLILVAGMFKIHYSPIKKYLEALQNFGALPIKDILNNKQFSETETDFIMVGNSLGELSALTRRPYSCQITAFYPSQTFIIPLEVLNNAFKMSSDPVNGLASRMWKSITFTLARRILLETSLYHSMPHDVINEVLDRAFAPNTSYFEVLVTCDLIEDVLLIEGLVIDYNTREIYTAPCYIPRTVNKMMLPQSNVTLNELGATILLIIPLKSADKYEVMHKMESVSELLPNVVSPFAAWSSKLQKHKKRNSLFSMKSSSGALKYSITTESSGSIKNFKSHVSVNNTHATNTKNDTRPSAV